MIATIEQDGDDLVIPLTQEMSEQFELIVGDVVVWATHEDGSASFERYSFDKHGPIDDLITSEIVIYRAKS